MPKLVVVGMGYVGIPVACAFADKGHDVIGIDIVKEKIDKINDGKYPISGEEPGLEELLKSVVQNGRLRASQDYSECKDADYIIVCVETPLDQKTKKPDRTALESAIGSIGKNLSKETLVSIESTIAPLTTQNVIKPILERESKLRTGKDFYLAHCPERLMAGRLLLNLETYDRVIGGLDKESTERAKNLYNAICKGKLHTTDCITAEIVKTTENTYRDVQIAFANEIGLICDELGVNAFEVKELVNTCPFRDMHTPGPGVGGHCIPKDPLLLLSSLKKHESKIIKNARMLNDSMPLYVVGLVEDALKEANIDVKDSSITILGLSYLKNSGDTRNSPSISVFNELKNRGAKVQVHDAYANHNSINVIKSLDKAIADADCAVLLTAHDEYKYLDFSKIGKLMKKKVFVDTKNLVKRDEVSRKGFIYRGLGKPLA